MKWWRCSAILMFTALLSLPTFGSGGAIRLTPEKPLFVKVYRKSLSKGRKTSVLICVGSAKEYSPNPKIVKLVLSTRNGNVNCELAVTQQPVEKLLGLLPVSRDIGILGADVIRDPKTRVYCLELDNTTLEHVRVDFFESLTGLNLTYYVLHPRDFPEGK